MKHRDPIVDEIRTARDAIARESDYDLEKLAQALRKREAESGRPLVRLPPRRPIATRKAA
jgi:hypothetical protein